MADPNSQFVPPEWLKLVAVGVVAVVLAAIGWAVSGSFEQNTAPVAAGPSTTTTASATESASEQPPATTAPSEIARTTQPTVALTARLALSHDLIELGADGETAEVQVTNDGDGAGSFSVTSAHVALGFSPESGEVPAGESATITVSLDRTQMEEGEYSSSISVSWDGGGGEIAVTASLSDNPIIHNPTVSPSTVQVNTGSDCNPTRTTISARVRDSSELESVVVRWNDGTGNVESLMQAVGEDMYEAKIGPFTKAGSVSAKVVATDIHGNAGGASANVVVTACS